MNKLDELDKVLTEFNEKIIEDNHISVYDLDGISDLNVNQINEVLDYLTTQSITGRNTDSEGYFLTYKGRLFIDSTPKFYRKKPFRYRERLKRLSYFWTFVKSVGLIIYGLILLGIAFFTYQDTVMSKRLETDIMDIKEQVHLLETSINKLNIENNDLGLPAEDLKSGNEH